MGLSADATTAALPRQAVRPQRWGRSALPLCLLLAGLCVPSALHAQQAKLAFPEKPFPGLAFGAFGPNEGPDGPYPTVAELRERLGKVAKLADCIRTYGMQETFQEIPRLCNELGVGCYPGAWIGRDLDQNETQIANLIAAGQKRFPTTKALIVGNEVLLRHDVSKAALLRYIAQVKQATGMRVGAAETIGDWLKPSNRDLASAVDVIMVNMHPYWDGVPVESAAQHVVNRMRAVKERFPGKTIIMGETGWPTEGASSGGAIASPANQTRFLHDLRKEMPAANWTDPMVFAAFDQEYLRRELGPLGSSWGVMDEDGVDKPALKALKAELAAPKK